MIKNEDAMDKKTVLIIEDDAFLIKAYRIKFEREGFSVLTAANGKEVLVALEKEPPQIVLLDLMLPGISGFDILETIRKSASWKNVPVIIFSNLGQSQDIEKGKKLGANEYFIKTNMKISDVVDAVRKYI